MIAILGFFFVFIVVLNLIVVNSINKDSFDKYSKDYPFYVKWEDELEVTTSNTGRFFMKAFFFIPTIISIFSRLKHSNE
ncbi:MAG: hypothetical protein ACI4UU_01205 [Clostridia bacterium]